MTGAPAPGRYSVVFCTTRFASFAEAQAKVPAVIAEHVTRWLKQTRQRNL